MADSNNALSDLLSDPEKMSEIISLASAFLGGSEQSSSDAPLQANAQEVPPASTDAGLPEAFSPEAIGASLMTKALPIIQNISKVSKSSANGDRIALLNAIRPFVASGVAEQMTRAIKMLSVAQMAKAAMNEFGIGLKKG